MSVDITSTLYDLPEAIGDALYEKVSRLGTADLASGSATGSGVFDQLMAGMKAHLQGEFEKGRITGAEYTKAYIALTQSAMQFAVQFVLGKEQSFWQAQQAQIECISGRIAMEKGRYDFLTTKFTYERMLPLQADLLAAQKTQADLQNDALTAQVTGETLKNETMSYTLQNILPLQKDQLRYQNVGEDLKNQTSTYNLAQILPLQKNLIGYQATGEDLKNQVTSYTLTNIMPLQRIMASYQNTGEDLKNQTTSYNLTNILPLQKAMIQAQTAGEEIKTDTAAFNLATIMPLQAALLGLQNTGEGLKNDTLSYTYTNILPLQKIQQEFQNAQLSYQVSYTLPAQVNLIHEQYEVQRAQTEDTKSNGLTITGLIGKQKDLYAQQVISYQRDSEYKVAKIYSDAWVTQKTIDEGLNAPNHFTNTSIDQLFNILRGKAGLV